MTAHQHTPDIRPSHMLECLQVWATIPENLENLTAMEEFHVCLLVDMVHIRPGMHEFFTNSLLNGPRYNKMLEIREISREKDKLKKERRQSEEEHLPAQMSEPLTYALVPVLRKKDKQKLKHR